MQENNFEKQVQQKTDELKLKPSDEVWQKVLLAIAKRKSGRRKFAIIFLLLLLISSATFILWDHTSGIKMNNTISEKNNPAKKNRTNEHTAGINAPQKIALENRPETGNKNSAAERIRIIKDNAVAKKTGYQHRATLVHLPVKTTISVAIDEPDDHNIVDPGDAKDNVNSNKDKVSYKTGQKLSVSVSNSNPVGLDNKTIGSNDAPQTKAGEITPGINDVPLKERITDSVSTNGIGTEEQVKDTAGVIQKTDLKKTASAKGSLQTKQRSAWKIGFNLSLGAAATQNGYLGIIGSGSSDESKAFTTDPSQSTGGNAGGQVAYIAHTPSKITTGTGLVLGLFLQKNISSKTNLLFGLNYKIYNSAMMIGKRVDSSSNFSLENFFYRSGNSYRYKNHFHFLELPVALRFKLGKQNKLPVYLNTGVSVARLVGSNALQFDTLSGSYYGHNALLNKTQVNISLGLLFSLFGRSTNPFLIGPDINISLNKMANSGLYKDRHYSYFGILVQKSIGKK
jgi:Outer membrane protein beta-barrel domain